MEKSPIYRTVFHGCAIALIIGVLVGCAHDKPLIRTKSETELAVAEIKAEWLIKCEGLTGAMPPNETGALINDYIALSEVAATCVTRYNSFIDYIKPVVEKERASKPANQ